MMMVPRGVLVLLFVSMQREVESREGRVLNLGAEAIMTAKLLDTSEETMYRCGAAAWACVGPNAAELGLELVAARTSAKGDLALVELLRVEMDGSLSTTHTCHVLARGVRLLPLLRQIDSKKLNARCRREVDAIVSRRPSIYSAEAVSAVCAPAENIAARASVLISTVKANRTCLASDW